MYPGRHERVCRSLPIELSLLVVFNISIAFRSLQALPIESQLLNNFYYKSAQFVHSPGNIEPLSAAHPLPLSLLASQQLALFPVSNFICIWYCFSHE